jgi:Fe-S cluster assembly scaffold protein SufB
MKDLRNLDSRIIQGLNFLSKTGINMSPTDLAFFVDKNEILHKKPVEGIKSEIEPTPNGIKMRTYIEPGVEINFPVALCFGNLSHGGRHINEQELIVGEGAKVKIYTFAIVGPGQTLNRTDIVNVKIGKNAKVELYDIHYHDITANIDFYAELNAYLEEGAYFYNLLKITDHKCGKFITKFFAEVEKDAVVEVEAKLKANRGDEVIVKDVMKLKGDNAKGLSKSRIIALDGAKAEFIGEAYGVGNNCRAHIDCAEVVKGKEIQLKNTPILVSYNETAKLTHEASIGRIDKKQLQTLMAKGIDEEEATEIIVRGMLK